MFPGLDSISASADVAKKYEHKVKFMQSILSRLPSPLRLCSRLAKAFAMVLVAVASSIAALPAHAEIEVTDVIGREVVLAEPARRILIDDGRYLVALSLIHPDPVSVLAAWPKDIHRIGPELYEQYRRKFPVIEQLKQAGSSAGNFSVEQVLAAEPDLAIFSLQSMPTRDEIARIEAAGVTVAIIDFFNQPLENLEPGMRLLGAVTGRAEQAEAFVAFRRAHLDRIAQKIEADRDPRPRVFLEPHAARTDECCVSPGRGNIGNYIELAGGENIGSAAIPSVTGTLNLEYVIASDPQVYIATGGPHMKGTNGLLIGPGYDADTVQKTLARVAARNGISQLSAVREGHVHGLAHQLLNSPLDVLTVEVLATWIRPDLFSDVDPEKTLEELNGRFLAVPLSGLNWDSLH